MALAPGRLEMMRELSRERAALFKAQREKIEIQTAKLRGELVPRAIIGVVWERIAANVRSRVLSVASLSTALGAIRDNGARHAKLVGALADALEELSAEHNAELIRRECEKLLGETDTLDAAGLEAAAPPNGKPMGGRAPEIKPRARRGARPLVNGED